MSSGFRVRRGKGADGLDELAIRIGMALIKAAKPIPQKRNPVAKALSSPALRPQVVKARKGKGSYTRKPREQS